MSEQDFVSQLTCQMSFWGQSFKAIAMALITILTTKIHSEYITTDQTILMKGHIAFLSPLSVANGFVRPDPHLINGSLRKHNSIIPLRMASRLVQPFLHTQQQRLPMLFNLTVSQPQKLPLSFAVTGPPSNTYPPP